jgi:hypothetical protein
MMLLGSLYIGDMSFNRVYDLLTTYHDMIMFGYFSIIYSFYIVFLSKDM